MPVAAWKAGVWAGLIAGAIDLAVLTGIVLAQGVSPWVPARMTAAMVLGTGVLSPPEAFGAGIAAAALGVHFGLSLIYGVIIALLIQRLDRFPALGAGAAFGLGVWLLNYFVIAPYAFPWFGGMRFAPSVPFLHALFGVAAVGAYLAITARERRAGIERRQLEAQVAPERRRPFERRGPA